MSDGGEWKVWVKVAPTFDGKSILTTLSPEIGVGELRKRVEKLNLLEGEYWFFIQSLKPLTRSESCEPAFNVVELVREEDEKKTLKEMGGFDQMSLYLLPRFPCITEETTVGNAIIDTEKVGLPKSLFKPENKDFYCHKDLFKLNISGNKSASSISYEYVNPEDDNIHYSKSVMGQNSAMKLNELASHLISFAPSECHFRIQDSLTCIKFTLKKGVDLKAMDSNGFSDPYVNIIYKNDEDEVLHKEKTAVIKKTLNPEWNHEFIYRKSDKRPDKILFQVYDKDMMIDDKIGKVTLDWIKGRVYRTRHPRYADWELKLVPFNVEENPWKEETEPPKEYGLGTIFLFAEKCFTAEAEVVTPLPEL